MIVYVSMLIISILFSLGISDNQNSDFKKKLLKIMVFLTLFFVMGLRYGVGQDYFFTYKPVFETILDTGKFDNIEFGFVLINKVIQLFTHDYAWIFIVTSFLFLYFALKSIYEQSENIPMSIFLLICNCFYFYAMNVVRQSIVIAIFIYSLKYIKERNFKKYVFMILIASCIHKIALIFLPLYWFLNLRIDKKKFASLTVGIYFLIPTALHLINYLLVGSKYENYLTGYYKVSEGSMISPLINFLIIIGCFVINKSCEEDGKLNIYKNIHILGFWTSMFLGTIPLISRIFVNFYQVQYLSIPLIISKFKNKNTRTILTMICIIGFLLNFIYSVYLKNGNNVLPYNWIFNR